MSKLICYSLFNAPCEPFEQAAYVRGFYFNCRFANLIYPDWRVHLEVDRFIYNKYQALFDWLAANNNLDICINEVTPPLCEGMLWRMKPIFTMDVSHILCRDCDALISYREAQAVQVWLEGTRFVVHAINDNPAHGGLMGGMVGFDCAALKAICGWSSWDEMITGRDLSERGSDQHFLNDKFASTLHPAHYLLHKLNGDTNKIQSLVNALPQVDPRLWESNLCSSFIGAAGFNELETLRFLQRFDPEQWNSKTGATGKYMAIEKKFPNLFYWHL